METEQKVEDTIETANQEKGKIEKKKSSKGIVVGVAIVIVTIIAVVAGVIVVSNNPKNRAKKLLILGNRYLDELDYDQAIAEYKAVLDIDTKNVDAYLGLAEAYMSQDRVDKAVKILEKGISETDSEEIKTKLDDIYIGLADESLENGDRDEALELLEECFGITSSDTVKERINAINDEIEEEKRIQAEQEQKEQEEEAKRLEEEANKLQEEKDKKYADAIASLDSGDYMTAIPLLEDISGYKDSAEKLAQAYSMYNDDYDKIYNILYQKYGKYDMGNGDNAFTLGELTRDDNPDDEYVEWIVSWLDGDVLEDWIGYYYTVNLKEKTMKLHMIKTGLDEMGAWGAPDEGTIEEQEVDGETLSF